MPLSNALLAAAARIALGICLLCAAPGAASAKSKAAPQYVELDGERLRVNWNDGDSFRVTEGSKKGVKARLMGYNALESYGPVHFWGAFHAYELYDVTKAATKVAKATVWVCTTDGDVDGYGRILVDCPKLRESLVAAGLAHIFAFDRPADPALVAMQLQAQNERKGMWAKGIPTHIVTSIHSTLEDRGKAKSYNRVCDTRTGASTAIDHAAAFEPCDGWCHGGSCMVYVPFEVRYGDKRPECAKRGRDNRFALPDHIGTADGAP